MYYPLSYIYSMFGPAEVWAGAAQAATGGLLRAQVGWVQDWSDMCVFEEPRIWGAAALVRAYMNVAMGSGAAAAKYAVGGKLAHRASFPPLQVHREPHMNTPMHYHVVCLTSTSTVSAACRICHAALAGPCGSMTGNGMICR
jgi:hypothetical protein